MVPDERIYNWKEWTLSSEREVGKESDIVKKMAVLEQYKNAFVKEIVLEGKEEDE